MDVGTTSIKRRSDAVCVLPWKTVFTFLPISFMVCYLMRASDFERENVSALELVYIMVGAKLQIVLYLPNGCLQIKTFREKFF